MTEPARERAIGPKAATLLVQAATSRAPASLGPRRTINTHEFYRYPARFPADLARAVIEATTSRCDVVLDPFVGGGTTLVESRLTGRIGIGADLNQLATFVSRVKTTVYADATLDAVSEWAVGCIPQINIHAQHVAEDDWIAAGYLRNVEGSDLWRLRKFIAIARAEIDRLSTRPQCDLARCALLRTSQWALDMRARLPSIPEFRGALLANIQGMEGAARAYARSARKQDRLSPSEYPRRTVVIDASAQELPDHAGLIGYRAPSLVMTSPPYPGVYVNYHRWKLRSRSETPIPYWIANQLDGHGLAHYTMKSRVRKNGDLSGYFKALLDAFTAIASLCDGTTLVAQVVGFSNPRAQLPLYLDTMRVAGFEESVIAGCATEDDGRLWRSVPGRRWWTRSNGKETAREVVLFHRPLKQTRRSRPQ